MIRETQIDPVEHERRFSAARRALGLSEDGHDARPVPVDTAGELAAIAAALPPETMVCVDSGPRVARAVSRLGGHLSVSAATVDAAPDSSGDGVWPVLTLAEHLVAEDGGQEGEGGELSGDTIAYGPADRLDEAFEGGELADGFDAAARLLAVISARLDSSAPTCAVEAAQLRQIAHRLAEAGTAVDAENLKHGQ